MILTIRIEPEEIIALGEQLDRKVTDVQVNQAMAQIDYASYVDRIKDIENILRGRILDIARLQPVSVEFKPNDRVKTILEWSFPDEKYRDWSSDRLRLDCTHRLYSAAKEANVSLDDIILDRYEGSAHGCGSSEIDFSVETTFENLTKIVKLLKSEVFSDTIEDLIKMSQLELVEE